MISLGLIKQSVPHRFWRNHILRNILSYIPMPPRKQFPLSSYKVLTKTMKKHVAYMSQSLSDDEIKYSYIEKHFFSLVKTIEKFHHFILGKHM
jgi:hypothetical protein